MVKHIAANRLIHKSIKEEYVQHLIASVAIQLGNGLEEHTNPGPLITLPKLVQLVEDAVQKVLV